jgi:hypothetical protein
MTLKPDININMIKQIIIFTLAILVFSSCKDNKLRNDATAIVKEWTGKEIQFPENTPCFSMAKDTSCVDLYSDNYKVLLFVDSAGCTSCRLKLSEWKKIMEEADSVFNKKPEFIFYFQPKERDEKEIKFILQHNGFHYPVFIDKENEIDRLNRFLSNAEYQCFLLDKDNKVLMIGNPVLNPGIWILYKKLIKERDV